MMKVYQREVGEATHTSQDISVQSKQTAYNQGIIRFFRPGDLLKAWGRSLNCFLKLKALKQKVDLMNP